MTVRGTAAGRQLCQASGGPVCAPASVEVFQVLFAAAVLRTSSAVSQQTVVRSWTPEPLSLLATSLHVSLHCPVQGVHRIFSISEPAWPEPCEKSGVRVELLHL